MRPAVWKVILPASSDALFPVSLVLNPQVMVVLTRGSLGTRLIFVNGADALKVHSTEIIGLSGVTSTCINPNTSPISFSQE